MIAYHGGLFVNQAQVSLSQSKETTHEVTVSVCDREGKK
jgi:hypothetical protein